jgi:type IV pilus assembly protein PilB
MASPRLEDLLLQTRALSSMQIAVAKRDAETRHKRLAATLVDIGMMDEARLANWMADLTGAAVVHPLPEEPAPTLARRIPRAIAREYEVVPIALEGPMLTVATADTVDLAAIEVLQIATGLKIRPVIARLSELRRLVDRFYPEDASQPTMMPDSLSFADVSPGSATQVIKPRVPAFVAPTLEARVSTIERSIAEIEKRLAAIESALERVLPR